MNRIFNKNDRGFTLPEVLVSLLLLGVVVLAYLSAQNMYRYLGSYAKHKAQAIYVSQRLLEQQRQQPFAGLANANLGQVTIDSKGTFNTTADDFLGNALMTVTNLDANRKRLRIEVNWMERSPVGTALGAHMAERLVREYCSTDIANDAEIN